MHLLGEVVEIRDRPGYLLLAFEDRGDGGFRRLPLGRLGRNLGNPDEQVAVGEVVDDAVGVAELVGGLAAQPGAESGQVDALEPQRHGQIAVGGLELKLQMGIQSVMEGLIHRVLRVGRLEVDAASA